MSDFVMQFVPRWNMNFVFPPTRQPILSQTRSKETRAKEIIHMTSAERKTRALTKIKTALRNSKWYLSIVCSKSGTCLAFGDRVLEINKLFQHNLFNNVVFMTPISEGASGSTVGIKYELTGKTRYSSVAVLKSSLSADADNLMYEYMVGIHFINKMVRHYPVFLFTYGIYTRTRDITHISQLKTDLTLQGTNFDVACRQSDMLSLLIQHVEGKTLNDMFPNTLFIVYDLSRMLFIIYHALSCLSKQFTHYDLHTGNIMIMELSAPIEYVYHDEGVSFISNFIPKIIDYGRCFFDNGEMSSNDVYQEICATPSCNSYRWKCGAEKGFGWLNPTPRQFAVDSTVKNESHDLLLLSRINQVFTLNGLTPYVPNLVYGQGLPPTQSHYGTVENLQSVVSRVTNVHTAKELMKSYITNIPLNRPLTQPIMGRLHIYKDTPMEFERV